MRPLARVFAVTTDGICNATDFAERAVAIAAAGPAAGFVLRAPEATAARHAALAEHLVAIARPAQAMLLVHARPDLARAIGANGVQLRRDDLPAAAARRVLSRGWIGVSVHDRGEAEAARTDGADFVIAGNVFETSSHPDRPARGVAWLRDLCGLGLPVIAIGGITPARAAEVYRAGAWGIAAISALWSAADPGAATQQFLAAWHEAA